MKIYQVDSFTKEVFKGNPAAVAILDHDISDDTDAANCGRNEFIGNGFCQN